MRYKRSTVPKFKYHAALLFAGVVLLFTLFRIGVIAFNPVLLSPIPEHQFTIVKETTEITVVQENVDTWIDRYAYEYTQSKEKAEYLKYQLHCLYWKESRNGISKARGDGGKAAGSMQFWKATYVRFASEMMRLGLRTNIGSRLNDHDAIQVAAWAIANGHAREWGPVSRGECI
ncbi:MAG TPA: hypothetical protein ENI23_17245 [bacterium]|nr:hypothetical protein [bacterium]